MKTEKLPISVIVLSKQQSTELDKCLSSAEFSQEVIVEIDPNITDFSQARNKALQKATQPWVFFLDSDEIISQESISNIRKIIEEDAIDGVLVRRRDIFLGKELHWGEVGSVWILRMFKRKKGKFVRPVHEYATVKGIVKKENILLLHRAHPSTSQFLKDISSYAQIEARLRHQQAHGQNQKLRILFEMMFYPIGKFLLNFILKLGILDGWRGFIYAFFMSFHSLLVRVYVYEYF